ncbi:uncharacterized protein LOC131157627 isoform X2 [Malania oleifera]|uniref:uncharacterized protein LOC131157627 isoform X2 n=1 Tax=Malania oleifera TaxID=397392 RepID=UPI0025AEBCA7|nr:uncharacterized protein LOC131157627 isoform X2 [Malania oleifera]
MEFDSSRTEPMELKVRALLKEVQLDYTPATTKLVDGAVAAIKESIDKIPEDLEVTADLAPGFVRDIGADAHNVGFKFKRPKSLVIGGSYPMRCIAKPDVNVDLFIRLPKACFDKEDYLDYCYHAKRCLYLCIIKKYLKLSSFVNKVEWSTFQNEARKPVLVVYPAVKAVENHGLFVRIIPTAKSLFKIYKLKLKRNSFCSLKLGITSLATPKYNSSILEDMFLEDNAEFVNKTFSGWKELGEALILIKVWARRRSSIYAYDCLNGFLISVLLAFLATESGNNCINRSMKPMQIFRVTLDFIATSKLWDNGLCFQLQGLKNISEQKRMKYKQSFPVVICDPFAYFNFAFRMTRNGFLELREEAALTISCLYKCKDVGFEKIFMTKVDFPAKYDYCIRLNLKGNAEFCASGFCLDEECWRMYELKIHFLLHQGLKDRAKSIRVTWRNTPTDCNIENGFSMFDREPLLVGISVSSLDKALRMVDIGPSGENKEEAFKFRKFWGDKAELRGFKDGTTAESTVWECKQWERHLIIKRITEHVLLQHLSISKENIVHVVDQLDFSLLHGGGDPISFSGSLLVAFEVLSKRLHLLQDIPLRISSVQPLDPAFRFTSVYPPEPHPLAYEKGGVSKLQKLTSTCIQPLEVMIQLEGSGNWPLDEVAMEKTKSAFLIKIGESLQNSCGMTCTATEDDVDVFMSGYAFRLKILHERGLSLLNRQNGSDKGKQVFSADKKLFFRSQHSSMINGLQGRYPTYGPVVRLAKRWIASHLFSACLVEEAVELLVAYVFSTPLPFYAPHSRVSGFLRFLRLISEYDWTFSPLVVDINNDLTPDDEKEITENFMSSRKACEENAQNLNPAMFLATAYDRVSEAWTRFPPISSELRRLVAYARSSANLLTKLILQHQIDSYGWECLFRTPLNNYDALILLHRDRLAFPQRLLFPSEPNQGRHVASGNVSKDFHPFLLAEDMKRPEELKYKLMVNFDPLRCFVGDLEKEFLNVFKVWYDSLGGDAIGLTWERSQSKKRGREEVGMGGDIEDPVGVLRTVGDVGRGFVRSVYFLKAPRVGN